jgi:putative Mg2+ transporter-C (MgtC) family protein
MDWTDAAVKLTAAAVIGAAIGLDRELRHKSAGVRTIGLVALGAAVAVMAVGTDPDATSRVVQGTLAGIGFLGAGVIMHHGRSIEGLTTAASIWTAAGLGAACGLGAWPLVGVGSLLVLALLVLAGWAEHHLGRKTTKD